MSSPLIFLSAGEASGERYGALVIEAVRRRVPSARFFGLGGQAMEAAGCERTVRAEDIAEMGITEVILHMPRVYAEYRKLIRAIRQRKPDVAVLIDFPDVNFRLARELKKLGVPVVYFVSPQLWAWKKRRIHWVRDRVTKMLVIFPFEEKYYRERGVDAEFVGHPLADLAPPTISREEFAHLYGLNPSKEWVGLLPGSRTKEIGLNLPAMMAAADQLGDSYDYLLPAATTLGTKWVRTMVAQGHAAKPGVHVPVHVVEDARGVLQHARASVVASGTATVEAALIGNPFIAVYRLSWLSYAVASRLVKVPHVAMVNLIAEERIVPELIQDDFTPENVVRQLRPLLEDENAREVAMQQLRRVSNALRRTQGVDSVATSSSAIERTADWVVQFMPAIDSCESSAQAPSAPA